MVPTEELEDYRRRSPVRRVLVIALGVVLGGVALWFGLQPAQPDQTSFPEFELQLLSGDGTITSEELKGAPVVINFFASWCAPCQEEAPLLERMWREYEDEGVRFVGISIQDTPEGAKVFVDRFGISYPVARDPDQQLARKLDLIGLPQTFFVDRNWRFASRSSVRKLGRQGQTTVLGAISEAELRREIERLLQPREGD